MKPKTLIILLILLGLGVAGLKVLKDPGPGRYDASRVVATGSAFIENLDLNTIARVEITRGTNEPTVLVHGDGWRVDSRYGYPADFAQLSSGLKALADLKVGQVVPGGDELLEELELTEDQATHVVLSDKDDVVLADFQVGAARSRSAAVEGRTFSSEHYARLNGESPVLLDGRIDLNYLSDAWLFRELLDVPAREFKRVEVTRGDESYVLTRTDKGDHVLSEYAEGEKPEMASISRVAKGLQGLRLASVGNPLLKDEEFGLDDASVFTAVTDDGLAYKVLLGNSDERGRFARLKFSYSPPPEPARADALLLVLEEENDLEEPLTETEREQMIEEKLSELKTAHQERIAKVEAELEELKELERWVVVLGNYQAESLSLPRSELILDGAGQGATGPGSP